MAAKKDSRLTRAGVAGYNKPKRTPGHPKKSHVVVAKQGDKVKTIRFGEQGASTAGKPKAGESAKMKAKRKSFKARHGKNIARGKMSAGLSFLTGNNAEAEATGNWYIEDSSFTIRIWQYSEAKDLINIIERNLVLK